MVAPFPPRNASPPTVLSREATFGPSGSPTEGRAPEAESQTSQVSTNDTLALLAQAKSNIDNDEYSKANGSLIECLNTSKESWATNFLLAR